MGSVPEPNAEIPEGVVASGAATGDAPQRGVTEGELPDAEAIIPKEPEVAADEKSDEEAASKGDKTEERGEHAPPPKRLRTEIAEKIPLLMAKVEEGYALTGQALQAVQGHLDVQKRMSDDFVAFVAEYHGDKVSTKYALAATNNLGDKVRDIAWQVSGNKADVNNSLKSLSQKLLSEVSQLHSTTKSNHTSLLEAVKGINEGLKELARAVTSMSNPVGMPSGSVPETPMTPGPKASMAPPPEYGSSLVAAAPPVATYGQPGYSSQSFNQTLGKGNPVGPPVGPPVGAPVGGTPVLPPQAIRVSIDESVGLGMVCIGNHMHRRLPLHFLP